VLRAAPRTAAAGGGGGGPPHHVMKEVKPMLSENLRLGKSIASSFNYDNQQTGAIIRTRMPVT